MTNKPTTESKLSKKKFNFLTIQKTISASEKYIKEQLSKKRKHIDMKTVLLSKFSKIMAFLTNVVNKVSHHSKKAKKMTKIDRELAKIEHKNVILGICQLLVFVSVAYSTAVIYTGVDSLMSKIALLPQVIFALIILVKSFSKLYK